MGVVVSCVWQADQVESMEQSEWKKELWERRRLECLARLGSWTKLQVGGAVCLAMDPSSGEVHNSYDFIKHEAEGTCA